MGAATIDLQRAAEQLGVHYQTAYKWVRSGELRAEKIGGQYRLDTETVARFAERRRRPTPAPPRVPRGGYDAAAARLYDLVVAGEERAARRAVAALAETGVDMTTISHEVLAPVMRRVGDAWEAGAISVAIEHRSAAIVERALGEHVPTPRGRRRGVAMVAAVEGERHSLPTLFAATALRDDNWYVHHLGADLPTADIERFCEDADVDLVVLSATMAPAVAASEQIADRLRTEGITTLVGAPGDTLLELQQKARSK